MGEKAAGTDAVREASRRVLVTGGAGLLGTSVVHLLQAEGHRVAVLDDGSGGTCQRLDEFTANPTIAVHRVDLRDRAAVADVCVRERPWAVIHLAGRHFIPYCEAHPQETWDVNVEGTATLLDALRHRPPRHLVFASTADVYQESSFAHKEGDPLEPPTVYGRSKLAAERLLEDSALSGATRIVTARLFNLYGLHHTVDHLIPTIVMQALGGSRLHLGDLTTVRDYMYVDDAAAAMVGFLAGQASGVYNIGTGVSHSGKAVVELTAKLLGRDLAVECDARRLRRHNRLALMADPAKLRAFLPFWSATQLDEGLQRVIDTQEALLREPALIDRDC